MTVPINLLLEFGHKWRVAIDASGDGQRHDPWRQVVVCKHGFVYPAGPSLLGAAVDGSNAAARRLCEIEGVRVVQNDDCGVNVIFPRAQMRFVQRVMRPRRVPKRLPSDTSRI